MVPSKSKPMSPFSPDQCPYANYRSQGLVAHLSSCHEATGSRDYIYRAQEIKEKKWAVESEPVREGGHSDNSGEGHLPGLLNVNSSV